MVDKEMTVKVFLLLFWKWQACIGVFQIIQEACLYPGLEEKDGGLSVKMLQWMKPLIELPHLGILRAHVSDHTFDYV